MRYHYFYQSAKNENFDGWMTAKDRNDVYAQLKKRGIKPFKVLGRDPIGLKRWMAIVVLGLAVIVLAWLLLSEAIVAKKQPRAQLYGDPAILQQLSADGWRKTFNDGNAWFARHAIQAATCDCEATNREMVLDVKPLRILCLHQHDAAQGRGSQYCFT